MRALLVTVLLAACTGASGPSAQPDLAQASPDLGTACSTNPMTHVELLNACTTADSVDKTPFYPTLAPNGELPPLP
jgi:hypothetical protein